MENKTMKKWKNHLMKSVIFVFNKGEEIRYVSSKQIRRLLHNKEFNKFFSKYQEFKFEDIKFYLIRKGDYYPPIYNSAHQNYIVRTKSDISDYTLIIDKLPRKYVDQLKRKPPKRTPLSKTFINRILNNKSFQYYINNHWQLDHETIHIIAKSSEWYGIWWYKYPDVKILPNNKKYRCIMVFSELRGLECYILENKNQTAFYA